VERIKELLERMTIPASGSEPAAEPKRQYSCPLCQDRGIVVEGEFGRPCACMKQQALINRFKHANIRRELAGHTFERFSLEYYPEKPIEGELNQRLLGQDRSGAHTYQSMARKALAEAREFVRRYLADPHCRGVMFTGGTGSGKTFLAAAIANALLERGVQVLFVVVPDLLDEIRASYDRTPDQDRAGELELMEAARNSEVLILDDLGAHNYTEWTRNKLYSIINYRLNNQLPIVITTNLLGEDLELHLGERTTSRIVQACQFVVLLVERDIRYLKR
jgi:DNA replication protein DnaC